jgi:SSS family solute:Na+ symporter
MENFLLFLLLVSYLGILVSIGLMVAKKAKTSNGFFLANRSLGWFPLTATITATVIGGSATIVIAQLIYLHGLPAIWLDIGAATGLIILGITLARLVRKTGLVTLPEITGHLFNQKVRAAASVLAVLTQIAWVSILIQGTGVILSVFLPYDYVFLLIGVTFVFILYTLIGGQFAVVYTDIIQFVIMIVGVCVLAAPLLFMKAAPHFADLPTGFLSFPTNSSLGVLPVLSFFFMMIMPHIVGPDIYSKLLSAKNERTARHAAISSGILRLIFSASIAVIGLSAVVLIPGLPLAESAQAMPLALMSLDPVIATLVLAAFVSVMLSSADSILLSAGTILSVDLSKKNTVTFSRLGILITGSVALLLALYLQNIITTLKLAYTVFTAGLTLPIIFGFYKEKTKVTSTGALLGLLLGGTVSLLWLFLNNPLGVDAVLIGLLASLLPLLIVRGKHDER